MNDAIAQLTYARQLGYAGPQVTLLLADANIRLKKNSEGPALLSEAMQQQRAAGGRICPPWYHLAAAIHYAMTDRRGCAGWSRFPPDDYTTPATTTTPIRTYQPKPAPPPAQKHTSKP